VPAPEGFSAGRPDHVWGRLAVVPGTTTPLAPVSPDLTPVSTAESETPAD